MLNRFIEIALRLTEKRKGKVALISRLASLETQDRYDLYMNRPPRKVYVSAKRVDFINGENGEEIPSAMAVGWTVWDWGHMDINNVQLGWLSGETKGETRNKTGKTLF